MARTDTFTPAGLNIARAIVAALAANGVDARIDTTYMDYGQDWKWQTVIVDGGTTGHGYQALNPRQVADMNANTFDYAEINEIVAFATRGAK